MTPTLVQILAKELRELLSGARLSHISQSSPECLELSFYHPDRSTIHVTTALFPLKPLLFVSPEKRPALQKPPNFCRSLRKHLEYATLTGLEAAPGERLLHFLFKTQDGDFRLVFEGLPKYPNLILVGPDNGIISAMRYKNDVERLVMPEAPYEEPPRQSSRVHQEGGILQNPLTTNPPFPPLSKGGEGGFVAPVALRETTPDKPNLWTVTEDELRALWEKAEKPPLAPWLKESFRGSDSELASYLENFGAQAFSQWATARQEILSKGWKRFVLYPGPPPTLKIFPSKNPDDRETRAFHSAAQALGQLFLLESSNRILLSERAKLESEVSKALKHEKRILEKLKKDRSEAERSDQYQWWGELVMAQLHKVKPHLSEISLPDVVRGAPGEILIPLDKDATPLMNAQRFFKKAQKGSRGLALVEARQKEIQERLDLLKSAQRSLPALLSPEEIRKARRDLFPKKPEIQAKPKKAKEEKVATPNILREKLGKGFELCAGNSAAANEYVTFQLAQPEDLWFHVRDLPGSHVILRRLQRDSAPTEEMILQAAKVAATKSKANPGEKVTVSYTQKKNVKKIPGAPMGMVTMTKEKSLYLEVPEAMKTENKP